MQYISNGHLKRFYLSSNTITIVINCNFFYFYDLIFIIELLALKMGVSKFNTNYKIVENKIYISSKF